MAVAAAAASGGASSPTFADMSVGDLKEILTERGVSFVGCTEKHELVSLCEKGVAESERAALVTRPGVFHDIEQNTPQWHGIRRGALGIGIGASEAGDAIGASPYSYPYSLYDKLIAQLDDVWDGSGEASEAVEHGNACEDMISEMYAHYTGSNVADGGFFQHPHPDLGKLYGASPDGRVLSKGLVGEPPEGMVIRVLEIKSPFGSRYTKIPPQYMAQMQFQMWCSGVEECDFVAVKLDHANEESGKGPEDTIPSKTHVYYARVYRCQEYIEWMVPRLFFFSECLMRRRRPPQDLYRTEKAGYTPIPKPRIEVFPVETGAWQVPKKWKTQSVGGTEES